MSQPLVSIIIPCYNAEKWVAEAIQSAMDQTWPNIEVIVIDDGSTDGSLGVIKSFGDQVHWKTGPNRGGCAARNAGFAISRGEYVKFLDADDLLACDSIEVQMCASMSQPGCVLYGPWKYLSVAGETKTVVDSSLQIDPAKEILGQWLAGRYCAPHSLLWPRSELVVVGPWDETLTANQDGDMFMRAILAGLKLVYVPGGTVYYRTVVAGDHASVSSRRALDSFRSRRSVLDKFHTGLKELKEFEQYAHALGESYCYLARVYSMLESRELDECYAQGLALTGGKIPGGMGHRLGVRLLGIRGKERFAQKCHLLRKHLAQSFKRPA